MTRLPSSNGQLDGGGSSRQTISSVFMLMLIVVLAVWSVSFVGTVVLFRNAMTTEQSVAATPDPRQDPESATQPPLEVAAE